MVCCVRKFQGGLQRYKKYIKSRQMKHFSKEHFLSDRKEIHRDLLILLSKDEAHEFLLRQLNHGLHYISQSSKMQPNMHLTNIPLG